MKLLVLAVITTATILSRICMVATTVAEASKLICLYQDYIPYDTRSVCATITSFQQREPTYAAPRRNFALNGGGAAVLPDFTSQTHNLPRRSIGSNLRAWLSGLDLNDADVVLPIVVLESGMRVGDCWEFTGETGQIGIRLSGAVQISDVTLDHIHPSAIAQNLGKRAPREFALWGLVRDQSRAVPSDLPLAASFLTTGNVPSSIGSTNHFTPLMEGQYDIAAPLLHQTFVLPDGNSARDNWYDTLILRVNSNWGANTTCMYHFGVYGTEQNGG